MYPCSLAICRRIILPPTATATNLPTRTVTNPVSHPDAAPIAICFVADPLEMSPKKRSIAPLSFPDIFCLLAKFLLCLGSIIEFSQVFYCVSLSLFLLLFLAAVGF
uniref:Uncharacterized protein n=1 Tax=Lutzomyia longipalpis TaxID=7200 RepID=A0A7G3B5N7_LUTLO